MNRRGPHLKVLGKLTYGQPALMKLDKLVSVNTSTGSSQTGSPPTCSGDARLRPLDDPGTLLLGDPTEDRHEQTSDRPSRVEPRLTDADDFHAESVKFENVVQVGRHGPPEPVERPDHQNLELPLLGIREHLLVHRTVLHRRDPLFVDVNDSVPTGSGKLLYVGPLTVRGLLVGRDAEIDGGGAHAPTTPHPPHDQPASCRNRPRRPPSKARRTRGSLGVVRVGH